MELSDPWGNFTLSSDHASRSVFLCGGMGITPFLSMMMDSGKRRVSRKISLFFSNRSPEDEPFSDVVRELAAGGSENISLIETMSEADDRWEGERGPISSSLIKRHIKDIKEPIYYIAGPSGMIDSMRDILQAAGVPDSRVVLDRCQHTPAVHV